MSRLLEDTAHALSLQLAIRLCAAGALLFLAYPIGPRPEALAVPLQVAVALEEEEVEETKPKSLFQLQTQPREIREAIEDFQRFVKRATWEKAFKELEKIVAADPNKLAEREGGLLVPTCSLVQQLIVDLPPAGRIAYRLFYDPQAKTLLSQAKGEDEAARLEILFQRYLLTSVGDEAANRLGDLYFERGETERAAECWQAILDLHPHSALPRVSLKVKLAIALARSQQWSRFEKVLTEIKARHGEERVELGGQSVLPAEHLATLAPADARHEGATSAPPDFVLPDSTQPLWQFRYLDPKEEVASSGRDWQTVRVHSLMRMFTMPAVADQSRVYVTLLDRQIALDLATGKLLWRTGRFHDAPQEIRNRVQQENLPCPERWSLTLAGGRLWAVTPGVSPEPPQGEQEGVGTNRYRLLGLDPASGKVGFDSAMRGELKSWDMRPHPVFAAGRIYIVAGNAEKTDELSLLAFTEAGTLLWSTPLGTYAARVNQGGWGPVQRSAQPSLVLLGNDLLVDTNAGAVVALDLQGRIRWAREYEVSLKENLHWRAAPPKYRSSEPQWVDGVYFVKGMASPRLVAIEGEKQRLAWKRSVPGTALLVGMDQERIYLGGDGLLAYDRASQQLLWSTHVPAGGIWNVPLLTASYLYQFTPRGIFQIDKVNGQVVHLFRGVDLGSWGGRILVTPRALVTISESAVTAYAWPKDRHQPAEKVGARSR